MVAIRADSKAIYPRYLFAVLRSPLVQERITQMHVGSLIPHFKKGDFDKLLLPVPRRADQEFIGDTYFNLSAKIELNRRRNQTLEAMARALFKDWFVDFGPVRAKMEGREPYLPADLWQRFPDRLDDDGKPEGWETKRVSDYLSLAYGKSLPAAKRHTGGVPVYGSGGITGFHSEALVNEPTVIVGRKGTVGSLYWENRPCFPIDTVFFVQPEAPLSFCYYLLESLPLQDMNTDAAVPGLNRENVYRLEVTAPSTVLIAYFAETISRFRETIAEVSRESETLAQIRDTLLPRLISGELRVSDAERFMDRVAPQAPSQAASAS
jgi:type I restriction enzyme S subunit